MGDAVVVEGEVYLWNEGTGYGESGCDGGVGKKGSREEIFYGFLCRGVEGDCGLGESEWF